MSSEVLLHKLKLFLMSRWVSIVMQEGHVQCVLVFGTLELPVLDGTQEGLRGMQIFLCGI